MKEIFNINQRFDFLDRYTQMVINGVSPSLLITGEGGLGKSYSVMQSIKTSDMLNDDYVVVKGYSTARGLYNFLYDNIDKLIIFDDCDSVLDDKVGQNILKSALDSYDIRTVSWMSKMSKNDRYPQQFNFRGRIIFISNKNKNNINEAILTRCMVIDLSMSPDDKIDRMRSILPSMLPQYDIKIKKDALEFLNKYKNDVNLNIRMLIMVIKIIATNPSDWENAAKYMIMS
jgi:hypothetical protein